MIVNFNIQVITSKDIRAVEVNKLTFSDQLYVMIMKVFIMVVDITTINIIIFKLWEAIKVADLDFINSFVFLVIKLSVLQFNLKVFNFVIYTMIIIE